MANPVSQTSSQNSIQRSNNTGYYFESLETIFDKIVQGKLPLRERKGYNVSPEISNYEILINIVDRIKNVAAQIENFQKVSNDLINSDNIPFEETQVVGLGERILELPNGVKHAELVPIDKCYSLVDDFIQKELSFIQGKFRNGKLTKSELSVFLEKTGVPSNLRLLASKIQNFANQGIDTDDNKIYFVNRISYFKIVIDGIRKFVLKQGSFMNDFNLGSLKRCNLDIIIQEGAELYQIIQSYSKRLETMEIEINKLSDDLGIVFKKSFKDILDLINQFKNLKKEFEDIANYSAINRLNENKEITKRLATEFNINKHQKLEAKRA